MFQQNAINFLIYSSSRSPKNTSTQRGLHKYSMNVASYPLTDKQARDSRGGFKMSVAGLLIALGGE
jgi:hypothetical protein